MKGNLSKVSLEGVGIYYKVHGEGQPLMLVHGFLASHTMWKYQVEDLPKSFRVITCDLRGHGESDKGDPNTYSLKLFADDIRGLLDKLGIEKAHLVGYSMGGLVAAQFAVDYPHRLYTLVLGGTPAKMPPSFSWLARLTPSFMIARMARLTVPRLAYDPKGKVAEEAIELMIKWLSQAGKATMIAGEKAGRAYFKKRPTELSSISVPVLIVCGEKDSLANGEELHKLIPSAKLVIVERSGHFLPVQRPEVFNRLISDFCVAYLHPGLRTRG